MARPRDIAQQIDNQTLSESSGSRGVVGSLAKMAGTMLAFQVGVGIYKTLTGKVNSGLGSIVTALRESGGAAKIARSMPSGKAKSAFSNFLTSVGRQAPNTTRTFSKMLSGTTKFQTSKVGRFLSRLDTMEDAALHSKTISAKMKYNPIFGPAKEGFRRGEAGFRQAITARAWRMAKEQAPIMPLFYISHRVNTRTDPNRRAWYNPIEVAKFSTNYFTGMAMFSGASPALKAIGKSTTVQSAISGFSKRYGNAIGSSIKKALEFGDRHKGRRVVAAVDAITEVRGTTHPRSSDTTAGFFSRMLSGVKRFKTSYRSTRDRLFDAKTKPKGEYEHAELLINKIGSASRNPDAIRYMRGNLAKDAVVKPSPIMNAINRIVGRKAIASDTFRDALGNNLKRGKGLVKFDGKSYDISSYMPTSLLRTALSIARIPKVLGHSPIDIMNIGSLSEWATSQHQSFMMRGGTNSSINLGHTYENYGQMVNRITKESRGPSSARKKQYFDFERQLADTEDISTHQIRGILRRSKPEKHEQILSKSLMDQMAASRHGQMLLTGNQNVYSVNGRLYLENVGRMDGKSRAPSEFFELGMNTRTGNAMRYRALPVRSGGVFSKVHDRYMGGSEYETMDGKTRHAGYSNTRPVDGNQPEGFTKSIRRKLANKFDIGGKDHPTIFGRVASWFKSFRDPLEPRMATNKINMNDPEIASLYASAKNPEDISQIGNMFARVLEKTRMYAYSKALGDTDDLQTTVNYLLEKAPTMPKGKRPIGLKRLIMTKDIHGKTDSDLRQHFEKLGLTNQELIGKSTETASTQSILKELGQGINTRSVFDVSRKIGAISISHADEWNSVILGNALKTLSVDELAELSGKLSNRSAFQALRTLQETSSFTKSPFSRLFDSVSSKNIQAKGRDLSRLMDLVRSNQDMVDATMKHTRPLYKLGGHRTPDLYERFGRGGSKHRLFVAEKLDVEGMPVNTGLFSGITPGLTNQLRDQVDGRLAKDTLTIGGLVTGAAVDSINNVANAIGFGFSSANVRTVGLFGKNLLTKRVLPLMGAMAVWNMADTAVDESGLFDNTALGEGLNVFLASQLMRSRLAAARILDTTGITRLAKKAEDVMPGSMTSPFSGAVRGLGAPLAAASLGLAVAGPAGAFTGGVIGGVFSLLTAGGPLATLGGYNITKSRKELIEEYSGRSKVAYKNDRGWLLGSTPLTGTDVDAFVPNWYARMRSGYRHTPVLYGSKMERMTSYLDPGHYTEKHANSRPYPTTGGAFANAPLIGNIIAFGSEMQHQAELEGLKNLPGGNAATIGMGATGYGMQDASAYNLSGSRSPDFAGDTLALQKPMPVRPGTANARIQALYYSGTELAGLRGFMGQALMDKYSGGNVPYADVPVYESSAFMTSPGRMYWEQGLGDLMGTTEFVRRLYPRKNSDIDYVNPLTNLMPTWIPKQFRTGDPYTKKPLGEIRMPGAGYESANDVNLTFPGDVSVIGMNVEETVSNYLFGSRRPAHLAELENRTKMQIAQSLGQANGNVKTDSSFFDPRLNLSGKADIYSNGVSYKIKALDRKQFESITDVTPDMEAQLSVLNGLTKGSTGMAVYVNAETGETKEFSVSSDKTKFAQGLQLLQTARSNAEKLAGNRAMKPNMNLGNAYSRMDRLKILADIAPQSEEYFSTLKEVEALHKYQYMYNYEVDMDNVQKKQFIRSQPKELYPYRFSKTAEQTSGALGESNSIKSEYGFIARKLGSAWETFSHMNTPIHRKMLDINSPYEAYDRTQVHGKEIKLWNHPYQHFIRPYMANMATQNNISSNMQSGAFGGFIFGGPVGAAIGAGAAGIAAGANSIFGRGRAIPGWRQKQRDIEATLDQVEYDRAMQQYQMTGDQKFLNQASRTMTYFNKNIDSVDVSAFKKAAPFGEKKYLLPMLETSNKEERAAILNTVPDSMKAGIHRYWNKGIKEYQETQNDDVRDQLDSIAPNWAGYNPGIKMDLIKTRIMNNEGLDARDAGVGWHSHTSELARTALVPTSFDSNLKIDVVGIQSMLKNALSSIGQVSLTVSPSMTDGVQVNLTVVGR